ncbi:MAG: site-specific integrase [Pyrinomonadaceae bacterium]|nr:site-specific integrase [Phycisphaerales bacterium]
MDVEDRSKSPQNPGKKAKPGFKMPAYRKRKGYDQAIVTLTDSATGKRRDYWLGTYGTRESRETYLCVITQWVADSRRFPDRPGEGKAVGKAAKTPGEEMTVAEVINAYWRWAKDYYRRNDAGTLKVALRLLRQFYGTIPATEFGPAKLRLLREAMVKGDETGDPPRIAWSRNYVNHQIRRIRCMFKWASSHELLPVSVHQALATVDALKRGRTDARESQRVEPAPDELIEACRPHLNRQCRAIMELQLLSGARCGELVIMRPIDIDMSGPAGAGVIGRNAVTTWTYRPVQHKGQHLGKERVIYLGPKAQEVLRPFLSGPRIDEYLFSPKDAEAERRAVDAANRVTPRSCGNKAGSNRKDRPKRTPGDHYTSASYYVCIQRACDEAWLPPAHLRPRELKPGRFESKQQVLKRLTAAEKTELKVFLDSHRWHPHQLRHNAATKLRKEFGLEAAQLVLGHSSASITDAVYAERDTGKIADVIRRVG